MSKINKIPRGKHNKKAYKIPMLKTIKHDWKIKEDLNKQNNNTGKYIICALRNMNKWYETPGEFQKDSNYRRFKYWTMS